MHGDGEFPIPAVKVDVAIFCGDLTDISRGEELNVIIDRIDQVDASLKLAIAGNHDWAMDTRLPQKSIRWLSDRKTDARSVMNRTVVLQRLYKHKIVYLEDECKEFRLENGASLKVFGSPYTPDRKKSQPGFRYKRNKGHNL